MFNHLTLRNRVSIQALIETQPNLTARFLANKIGIHPSSIYREIKRHRLDKGSKSVRFMKGIALPCSRLETFPFVCNACDKRSKCTKKIYIYDAYSAHEKAQTTLREVRRQPLLNRQQMKELDDKVSPRVMCHQSLYHILQSDSTITLSESTLRRYINHQYLRCRNIDLPRTVRFRVSKPRKPRRDRRVDISILLNRTYDDYQDYCSTTSRITIQCDLMIGKAADKRALLTLFEPSTRFQWGYMVYRSEASVFKTFEKLIENLESRHALFFDCIVVDNGAEFKSLPKLEENSHHHQRLRVFYCDPYASYQKGGCERNHSLVRYLLKKGESLDMLHQEEIETMFSHINSLKRKTLKGKSSFEMFTTTFQLNPSELFNIQFVKPKDLVLK